MVTPVWIGSPHYYDQVNVPKLFITLHWMVGNLLGTDRTFNGTRKASSTYGVEGDVVHQYVEERDYPFSDGNTYANQHTISIEHAGGWLLPDGFRFKPTQATHETSAQLCADIARRWGLGKLVVGVNIFPHSHWVATACPGSLDIGWIADRANQINGNPTRPVGPTGPASGGMSNEVLWQQQRLLVWGFNPGPLDGIRGPLTIAAIKKFQKARGLVVDGIVGVQTRPALAADPSPTVPRPPAGKLVVDGIWGTLTTKALQRALGVSADGVIGPVTTRALQRRLGVTVDGVIGPVTRRALQRHLSVRQDGVWGPITVRALQTRLNAGTF